MNIVINGSTSHNQIRAVISLLRHKLKEGPDAQNEDDELLLQYTEVVVNNLPKTTPEQKRFWIKNHRFITGATEGLGKVSVVN